MKKKGLERSGVLQFKNTDLLDIKASNKNFAVKLRNKEGYRIKLYDMKTFEEVMVEEFDKEEENTKYDFSSTGDYLIRTGRVLPKRNADSYLHMIINVCDLNKKEKRWSDDIVVPKSHKLCIDEKGEIYIYDWYGEKLIKKNIQGEFLGEVRLNEKLKFIEEKGREVILHGLAKVVVDKRTLEVKENNNVWNKVPITNICDAKEDCIIYYAYESEQFMDRISVIREDELNNKKRHFIHDEVVTVVRMFLNKDGDSIYYKQDDSIYTHNFDKKETSRLLADYECVDKFVISHDRENIITMGSEGRVIRWPCEVRTRSKEKIRDVGIDL